MPNLTSHLGLALEALERWGHPVLEDNLGSYLLGSASPDIRIITRQPRDHTHFSALDSKGVDVGVAAMLQSHPRLARSKDLSKATQAFIAGYITHLVADQVWIIDIYRPYFGNPQVYEDRAEGNVMDRALQLDIDRQDRHVWPKAAPLLEGVERAIEVEFITPEVLKEWRQWVQGYADREFTWERLHGLALRRQDPNDDAQARAMADRFLASVPEGLEQIYQRVSREKVAHFRKRAIAEFTRIIKEYLG
ncbi:MAG: hypothetical protein EXR55_01390 [Dehalococcoidia bacterium]|nr:hypothetical protein [Dehalococcoidia bacterium]